mmetsp:Transcript_50384/g.140983  ORF Transcript_50384/g.140983 Transcript_50384/m.140983 type:complete len:351 (+) Transcript_50384:72-1124(+)
MASTNKPLVLVTGCTGYIAQWVCDELLSRGYRVRGTVRGNDLAGMKERLKHFVDKGMELVTADLLEETAWPAAVQGCELVCHVASPFPITDAKLEELLPPARDGTLNVLRAAHDANVKKVVLTSSIAAVSSGWSKQAKASHGVFTEKDWSIVGECEPYPRSKTEAEKAAWEFVRSLPAESAFKLVTINPGYVQGPFKLKRNAQDASSSTMVRRILMGEMPAVPNIELNVVDVRDVASAHVSALAADGAEGRYIMAPHSEMLPAIARSLAKDYKPKGYNVKTLTAPYAVLWLYSFIDKTAAAIIGRVGERSKYDSSRAEVELGVKYRSLEETLAATAESLIEHGLVPPPKA